MSDAFGSTNSDRSDSSDHVTKLTEARTVSDLRHLLHRAQEATPAPAHLKVGFVPTMGFLHAGHAAVIRKARAENDLVVVSIFVNPTQFAQGEDLSSYPRDLVADRKLMQTEGVDILFLPTATELYPAGFASSVRVTGVTDGLEGASRPTHFEGVATIVLKLLNLVQPQRAYFGEKDWQQLAMVRQMVRDLHVPVRVVGVPTEREESGLARSSRNSYFTAEERKRAAVVARSLWAIQQAYQAGERRVAALLSAGKRILQTEEAAELDYLALVDEHMKPLSEHEHLSNVSVSVPVVTDATTDTATDTATHSSTGSSIGRLESSAQLFVPPVVSPAMPILETPNASENVLEQNVLEREGTQGGTGILSVGCVEVFLTNTTQSSLKGFLRSPKDKSEDTTQNNLMFAKFARLVPMSVKKLHMNHIHQLNDNKMCINDMDKLQSLGTREILTSTSKIESDSALRLLVAVRLFGVRLIDNMPLVPGFHQTDLTSTPNDPAPQSISCWRKA